MIGRIISATFQFCFMALAVDVIDRRGPSNEMCGHLQPKKTKVTLCYLCTVYSRKIRFTRPTLLTRRSALVFKVVVSYGWK